VFFPRFAEIFSVLFPAELGDDGVPSALLAKLSSLGSRGDSARRPALVFSAPCSFISAPRCLLLWSLLSLDGGPGACRLCHRTLWPCGQLWFLCFVDILPFLDGAWARSMAVGLLVERRCPARAVSVSARVRPSRLRSCRRLTELLLQCWYVLVVCV